MVTKIRCKLMNIDGTKYRTQYTEKFKKREAWKKPLEGVLRAFIPGTILEVKVEKGQVVKEGEVLLILEAMKMKNKLVSPFDGFVKKINVAEKQIVANKELLIEVERIIKEPEVEEEISENEEITPE